MSTLIPVVMSGGSGTRLWPVSRASFPKQFCAFDGSALIEETLQRLKSLGTPWVLTTQSLALDSERALRRIVGEKGQLILEPKAKNTAPAIALLCKVLQLEGKSQEIVGVFPADHHVAFNDRFVETVRFARECATHDAVVTLGIHPTYPATGYGYIETAGDPVQNSDKLAAYGVKCFREKPSLGLAKEFLSKGGFYWNAGIFIFKAERMISLFEQLMPDLWKAMASLKPDRSNLAEIYEHVQSQSIDYGIMEKLETQLCVPSEFGWSDLGSWDDVARMSEEKTLMLSGNQAQIAAVGAEGTFAYSTRKKIVGVIGIDDLIVVDMPDALLITRKGASQEVKQVVAEIEAQGRSEATRHQFELRPWGQFEVLLDTPQFKTKRITLDPKSSISYQSHAKRAEHWIIVEGSGEVVIDGEISPVSAGSHVHIPQGAKHRIRNNTEKILRFIEVQTGSYFGEDDIVRYGDDYGRS